MIVRMSKSEHKTLQALDPEAKGSRNWMTARAITGAVFRKKEENVETEEIRTVRNAFRKLVREELVEMGDLGSGDRGKYRIGERGRKILISEETEFESCYERGVATQASKEAGEKRKNAWEKVISKREAKAPVKKAKSEKAAPKKAAPKKAAPKRTAPEKKATALVKKAPPKQVVKAAPAKKAPPKQEVKTAAPKQQDAKGNGAPRTFQRKAPPPTVAEKQVGA